MPHVRGLVRQIERENVANEPADAFCFLAESRASVCQRIRSDVEHGDVRVTERDKRIDERRCSTADIECGGGQTRSDLPDELDQLTSVAAFVP